MAGRKEMTFRTVGEGDLDYYPTPPWVTRVLVENVSPRGLIWEPACGGGHMSEVLRETCDVVSTDIHDYGYPGMSETVDFLSSSPKECDWIITNPPFKSKLSERFVLRALSVTPNVAVLCRLTWLEGKERFSTIFEKRPPSRVIVLTERVGFNPGFCDPKARGLVQYAWYVWEKDAVDTRLSWSGTGSADRLYRDGDQEKYGCAVVGVDEPVVEKETPTWPW